jgi:hypothetical protein
MKRSTMMTTKVISQPIDPREAARDWLADIIAKHLDPELQRIDPDRIKGVAAEVEAELHERNMPIEWAIGLAIEWCEARNDEAGLGYDERR